MKDADNLDVDFELQEQAKRGVDVKNWVEDNRKRFVYSSLHTTTAKKMFEMLYLADPRDWHEKGKNLYSETS